jgi:hypothetical protein
LRTAQERMTTISLSDRPFDASDHPIRRSKHGRSPSGGGKLRHYLAEAPLTADRLASRFGHAADDGALPAADVEHPVGAGSDFGFCGAAGFAGRRLEGVSTPFVRHGLRRRLTRGQRQSPLWELDYIMATASSASASLQPPWRWRDGGPARQGCGPRMPALDARSFARATAAGLRVSALSAGGSACIRWPSARSGRPVGSGRMDGALRRVPFDVTADATTLPAGPYFVTRDGVSSTFSQRAEFEAAPPSGAERHARSPIRPVQ